MNINLSPFSIGFNHSNRYYYCGMAIPVNRLHHGREEEFPDVIRPGELECAGRISMAQCQVLEFNSGFEAGY